MGHEDERRVRDLLARGDSRRAATLAIQLVGPSALRYLRAVLRDEDDAKDAFSHWAERVWRALPGFRGEASLQTWALRIAYHSALALKDDAWRRRGRRLATSEASRIAGTVHTRTAIRVERQRMVLRELRDGLSLDDQTLLELRLEQGLSWAAIAEILGREGERPDPGTVAKRYERLKTRLAELLKRHGLSE